MSWRLHLFAVASNMSDTWANVNGENNDSTADANSSVVITIDRHNNSGFIHDSLDDI